MSGFLKIKGGSPPAKTPSKIIGDSKLPKAKQPPKKAPCNTLLETKAI